MSSHCYHCHQEIRGTIHFHALIDNQQQPMCCPGCQAVATAIVSGGLANYYSYRTAPAIQVEIEANQSGDLELQKHYQLYDSDDINQSFIAAIDSHKSEARFLLEGITCSACVWLLEHHLSRLAGVESATINLGQHTAIIVYNPTRVKVSELMLAVAKIGYKAHPWRQDKQEALQDKENRQFIRRLAVAGIGAMQVMMYAIALYTGAEDGYRDLMRITSALLTTPVVFYAAQPFFFGAWRSLKNRHLSMDVSVAIAIGGAYIASLWSTWQGGGEVYFDSVSMFTFFLLLGRYLELRARYRTTCTTRNLNSLLPEFCLRIQTKNKLEPTVPSALKIGDKVRILPGDSIPADGIIFSGQSFIDESVLTGEHLPVARTIGDTVIAGTINTKNTIEIEVVRTGQNTYLSAINRLVQKAMASKPDIVKVSDRIAGWFIGAVLLTSAIVYWYWSHYQPEYAFEIVLSVLVATCPCALSLATPTALTTVIGYLQSYGFLISRSHVLEGLNQVTHVVFDKTGTLTKGELRLKSILPLNTDKEENELLAIAVALESYSEHPIASAFATANLPSNQPFELPANAISSVVNVTGRGLEGVYQTQVWRIGRADYACSQRAPEPPDSDCSWLLLSADNQPQAWFGVDDTIRKEAKPTITALTQLGLHVELLSGDLPSVTERIGKQVGIEHCHGGAEPEHKLAHISRLQANGAKVLMVGDGINDIPVLAAADISIAMSNASELARTHADALLLSDNLQHLIYSLKKARQTRRIIHQNISWALVYNLLVLPIAACGLLAPWMAAIGMSASSLIVVGNAMRLSYHSTSQQAS